MADALDLSDKWVVRQALERTEFEVSAQLTPAEGQDTKSTDMVVIKPRKGFASHRVRVVSWAEAAATAPQGFLVEAYISGTEYAVDLRVGEKTVDVHGIFRRHFRGDADVTDSLYLLCPRDEFKKLHQLLHDACTRLAEQLKLLDGDYHIEWRINDSRPLPHLIEINPYRFGTLTKRLSELYLKHSPEKAHKKWGFYVLCEGEAPSAAATIVEEEPLDLPDAPQYTRFGMFYADPTIGDKALLPVTEAPKACIEDNPQTSAPLSSDRVSPDGGTAPATGSPAAGSDDAPPSCDRHAGDRDAALRALGDNPCLQHEFYTVHGIYYAGLTTNGKTPSK